MIRISRGGSMGMERYSFSLPTPTMPLDYTLLKAYNNLMHVARWLALALYKAIYILIQASKLYTYHHTLLVVTHILLIIYVLKLTFAVAIDVLSSEHIRNLQS